MCFKFRKAPGFSMSLKKNFNLRAYLFSLPPHSLNSLKSRNLVFRFYHLLFSYHHENRSILFLNCLGSLLKLNLNTIEMVLIGFCSSVNPSLRPLAGTVRSDSLLGPAPAWQFQRHGYYMWGFCNQNLSLGTVYWHQKFVMVTKYFDFQK